MCLAALGVEVGPSPGTVTGKRTGDPAAKREAGSWCIQAKRRRDHGQVRAGAEFAERQAGLSTARVRSGEVRRQEDWPSHLWEPCSWMAMNQSGRHRSPPSSATTHHPEVREEVDCAPAGRARPPSAVLRATVAAPHAEQTAACCARPSF